jgi:integrase
MTAWVYQDDKQVKKLGKTKASWYVGWYDPAGKRRCKSFGPGAERKRLAFQHQRKVTAELLTGTYQSPGRKGWTEFRQEYEARILAGMTAGTRRETRDAMRHFERVIRPGKMATIKTQTVDDYRAKRSKEPGKKKGEALSPATVNKELRHLRAVLRVACDWKYLPEMPRFRMLRESQKLPRFVTAEHFAAIYKACDQARKPKDLVGIDPADWWRGLVLFAYMTGWRIGEMLSLRHADLDLKEGTAMTRAEDNKGKRDERINLHSVVIEHLSRLSSFDPCVFPWSHNRRTLDVEFHRIQAAAGIHLPCSRRHEHTKTCHYYGFHDIRRAFATQNAKRLTGDALQKLMRHKSYTTTQRYINMASQLEEATAKLYVPDVLKARAV